jgi:hypothetical protein
LKLTSLPLPAAALLGVCLFAVTTLAQDPPPARAGRPHPPAPKPTNLKILPKTLTGDQVMDIMHGWEKQLGVECDTCHAIDPNKKRPNGRPALNFPDDSKPEKETARQMVKMTMELNQNYTSRVESKQNNEAAAKEVSCGTCHRGHFDPPAFAAPKDEEHEQEHEREGADKSQAQR